MTARENHSLITRKLSGLELGRRRSTRVLLWCLFSRGRGEKPGWESPLGLVVPAWALRCPAW